MIQRGQARASLSSRCICSGSSATAAGNPLTATLRSSRVSLRPVYLAHAARTELFDDTVMAEYAADQTVGYHTLEALGKVIAYAARAEVVREKRLSRRTRRPRRIGCAPNK